MTQFNADVEFNARLELASLLEPPDQPVWPTGDRRRLPDGSWTERQPARTRPATGHLFFGSLPEAPAPLRLAPAERRYTCGRCARIIREDEWQDWHCVGAVCTEPRWARVLGTTVLALHFDEGANAWLVRCAFCKERDPFALENRARFDAWRFPKFEHAGKGTGKTAKGGPAAAVAPIVKGGVGKGQPAPAGKGIQKGGVDLRLDGTIEGQPGVARADIGPDGRDLRLDIRAATGKGYETPVGAIPPRPAGAPPGTITNVTLHDPQLDDQNQLEAAQPAQEVAAVAQGGHEPGGIRGGPGGGIQGESSSEGEQQDTIAEDDAFAIAVALSRADAAALAVQAGTVDDDETTVIQKSRAAQLQSAASSSNSEHVTPSSGGCGGAQGSGGGATAGETLTSSSTFSSGLEGEVKERVLYVPARPPRPRVSDATISECMPIVQGTFGQQLSRVKTGDEAAEQEKRALEIQGFADVWRANDEALREYQKEVALDKQARKEYKRSASVPIKKVRFEPWSDWDGNHAV